MTVTRTERRRIEGTVVSDKMSKTITVLVERTYKHAKYKKYVRKAARYHAHDEKGEAHAGDRVEIMACRPMSRLKRWLLVRVIEKSKQVDAVDVTKDIGGLA
jgi:small subunit ribosomal protein S17